MLRNDLHIDITNATMLTAFFQEYGVWLIFVGVCVLLIWLIVHLRKDPFPYHARTSLLTKPEQKFYRVLIQAVDGEAIVFAKPRIADVLAVNSMKDRAHWQRCFNRIAQKHVDFVLCDKQDQAFICAIELNDSSHEREDRRKRDIFVMKAFKRAKLPLLMHPTLDDYSPNEIRLKLRHLL